MNKKTAIEFINEEILNIASILNKIREQSVHKYNDAIDHLDTLVRIKENLLILEKKYND